MKEEILVQHFWRLSTEVDNIRCLCKMLEELITNEDRSFSKSEISTFANITLRSANILHDKMQELEVQLGI